MPKQPVSSKRNCKTTLETDQILLEYYLIHGNYSNINQYNTNYPFTYSQSKQRWRSMKEGFTNRVIQSNPSTSTTLHEISIFYPKLKKTILFSITLNDEEKITESTRKEMAINLPPSIQKTPRYNRKGLSTFEIHPNSETIKKYFQNLLHDQTHTKKVSFKEINAINAEIGFAHYKSKNTTSSEPDIAAQLCSLNGKSYESIKHLFKVHSKLYHKKEKCSHCMGFACFNYSTLCKGCTYLKLIDHDPVIWIQKTANTNKVEWTFTLSKCNELNYTSLFNLKKPVNESIQNNDMSIQSNEQDEMSIQSDSDDTCEEQDEMMDETNVNQECNQSIQERIQTFYTYCHDYCNIFQENFNGFQEWKPRFENYEPPYAAHQLMSQAMNRNRNLLKPLPIEENLNFIWIENHSEKNDYSQWIELIENNFKLKTLDNFNATDPVIYVMIFIFKEHYQMEPMIQIGEGENYQNRMSRYKNENSGRLVNRAFHRASLIFCCPLEIQADTPMRRLKETFYICQLLEQGFQPLNSKFSDHDSVNRLHSIFDGKLNFSSLDKLDYSGFGTSVKLLHLDSDANNTIHIEKGNYVIESNNQVVLRKPFIFMLEREKFKQYFPNAPQKLLNAFNISSTKYQGLNNLLHGNDELYKEDYLPKCFGVMNRIAHPKGFGKYLRFDFESACLEYENGFYPISFLSIRCNYEQVIRKVIMKNTIMKDCICINEVEDDNFIYINEMADDHFINDLEDDN